MKTPEEWVLLYRTERHKTPRDPKLVFTTGALVEQIQQDAREELEKENAGLRKQIMTFLNAYQHSDHELLDWLEAHMKDGNGLIPHIKLGGVNVIYSGPGGVGVSLRGAIREAMTKEIE